MSSSFSTAKSGTASAFTCYPCAKDNMPKREPLLITPLPVYPWQIIGTDLFELSGEHYLLVMDYFSRYPEVAHLTSTTSAVVITSLKSMFARHGMPEIVHNDNDPQYASQEFSMFAEHINSSTQVAQGTHGVMGRPSGQ